MSGAARHSILTTEEAEGNMREVILEAQQNINIYLKPGLGTEQSVKHYDKTSDKYEEYVGVFEYRGPQKVAQTLAELYPEQSQKERVRILDVAAGTGLVGAEMHKLGFRNMDALDPSQGMLDVASRRGIYGRLFREYISDQTLPIDENSYDSIALSGGMGENQIPCGALHEMIRLVKPGGYIVNVTRVEHLSNCSDYIGRLEQLMEQLEAEDQWKQVSRSTFPNFLKGKEGLVMIHQVL